jgi:hypothetical protein
LPEEYIKLNKKMIQGIKEDILEISINWKQYQTWIQDLTIWVYDVYLKTQGVSEGIRSYDRLVMLARAWRNRSQQ